MPCKNDGRDNSKRYQNISHAVIYVRSRIFTVMFPALDTRRRRSADGICYSLWYKKGMNVARNVRT